MSTMMRRSATPALPFLLAASLLLGVVACQPESERALNERTLTVTATAYNAVEYQTSPNPRIAAWGDTLKAGMKAIAVSRDLIEQGLTHGTRVKIEGLSGEYVVRDKMDERWTKRIDIFMGQDIERAREWGERTVRIRWEEEE